MFAKTIVLSDAFLDMPLSARCLYFTLGMFADDDGFVNSPKGIMRQCGASEDDMRVLLSKKFVLAFESGVIVIKHWRINNYLRSDRYQQTKYMDEKEQLSIEKNGAYSLGIPNSGTPSIGKDSIGKDSIGKDRSGKSSSTKCLSPNIQKIVDEWNTLQSYGIKPVLKLTSGTKRYNELNARISQYSEQEVLDAIEKIRQSEFLQGKNKRGWVITFEWLVHPNNFPKVLEGQYENRQPATPEGYVDQVTRQINEVDNWI